ncbi:MAG: hypothetical protein J6A83_08675 [Clostridia bacterium]|nr:hypothetical protein [Clostridia bacterium]
MKIRYIAIVILSLALLLFGCAPDNEKDGEATSAYADGQSGEASSSQTTQGSSGIFEVVEGVGTLPSISFDDFKQS